IRHGPPDAGRAGHRTAARPDHPAAPHRLGRTSATVRLGPPPAHRVPHTGPDGDGNDPGGHHPVPAREQRPGHPALAHRLRPPPPPHAPPPPPPRPPPPPPPPPPAPPPRRPPRRPPPPRPRPPHPRPPSHRRPPPRPRRGPRRPPDRPPPGTPPPPPWPPRDG